MLTVRAARMAWSSSCFSWIRYSATPKSRKVLASEANTAATANTPVCSGVRMRAMIAVLAIDSTRPT